MTRPASHIRRLFLISALISMYLVQNSISARSQIVYGCKYSENLCSKTEACLEDNLFGTCQDVLKEPYIIQFRATDTLKNILEFSLKGLLELGYGWRDEYTQCIIGGLLQSYELEVTPEVSFCDKKEKNRLEQAKVSSKSFVEQEVYDEEPSLYMDETTPLGTDFLSKLSNNDLILLQNYLTKVSPPKNEAQDGRVNPTTFLPLGGFEAEQIADTEVNSQPETTGPELTDTDLWLLNQLLKDIITVDDLSSSQIKRLKGYLLTILPVAAAPEQETTPIISDQPQESTTGNPKLSEKDLKVLNEPPKIKDDQEMAIEKILRKFTAESMKQDKSDEKSRGLERMSGDIIGSQISNQLKNMQQAKLSPHTSKYVDKKSESSIISSSAGREAPDKAPELTDSPLHHSTTTPLEILDTSYVWISLEKSVTFSVATKLVDLIASKLDVDRSMLSRIRVKDTTVSFQVMPGSSYNSTIMAQKIKDEVSEAILTEFGVTVYSTGIGHDETTLQIAPVHHAPTVSSSTTVAIIATVLVMVVVAVVILITWRYMYRRWSVSVNKFEKLSSDMKGENSQDNYEDLCRQRMAGASAGGAEKRSPSLADDDQISPLKSDLPLSGSTPASDRLRSPRSSTSSWSEEPVSLTMDISTGHTVLSYMEDHLKNTERLEQEWTALCNYTPDQCDMEAGKLNPTRNRYPSILPYDHNRTKLLNVSEEKGENYINASFIADADPRSPVYITTQGPLQSTIPHFWQMVWEQDCTSIVMLTSLAEDNKTVCHQYWPSEGRHTYGNFEVHLVSEHIWCEGYLVRSFYLKNVETNQTRTVTQFHFLSWPELSVPADCKELLDFRRKVNKSYRGKTSPIVVCCSDGSGRSGTYILLDMVINRIHKGVKEVDIAASLEHIRDQRMESVQTREQFEFVLSAVAEEVQALLKALP